MKQHMKSLLAMTAMLATLSCQQSMYYDEDTENNNETQDKPLNFSGNIATRVSNNQWETGDKIGIYMFKTNETLSDESILNNSSNKKYIFSDESNKFTPQTENDNIYYPQTGTKADFIAYYPYKSNNNYILDIDVTNQANPNAIDFLYSNNLKEISREENVSTLKLNFTHRLSKVIFAITAGEGLSESDLKGIKVTLEDIYTKCSFNLSTADIVLNNSSNKNITALTNEAGTQAEAIVLPQSCANKLVKVTTQNRRSYTFKISSTDEWSAIHKYTYNITLNKDDYSIQNIEAEIQDWSDGGSTDIAQTGSSNIDNTIWDGETVNTDWYTANGTIFNLFTAEEVAGFAKLTNDGERFKDKTVNLMADIDLNNFDWTPICNIKTNIFEGTFDGGNYRISGLKPVLTGNNQNFALFGYNKGVIKNLYVDGNVSYEGSKDICSMAGIAGINYGTIENCHNYISITCTLTSIKTASLEKAILYLGGIAGVNTGTITNCQNEGVIYGENKDSKEESVCYIGGIVGSNSSVITNSTNQQNITGKGNNVYIGGIVGSLNNSEKIYGTISNSSNYGSIKIASAQKLALAGGIVGVLNNEKHEVSNSFNYGDVNSTIANETIYAKSGGIAGENSAGTLSSCTNAGTITATNSIKKTCVTAGGIVGNNTNKAAVHTCTNEAHGIVYSEGFAGGIAGYNLSTNSNIYACCINNGTPLKWIGNATGSNNKSGVTTTSHTEP